MTFLLIDVGNTNIKFGIGDEKKVVQAFVLPTNLEETADSLGLKIHSLINYACAGKKIIAWVVCSVVPLLNSVLEEASYIYGKCPLYFVPRDIFLDIENHYKQPQEVGADRLIGAYAARKLFSKPSSLIIIDFGTATTFDCVENNAYLGGLICPGIRSSLKALSTQTAKLPQISLDISKDNLEIGRSTKHSLNQGMLFGFASMVDGLVGRLKEILKPETKVVATGGLASLLATVSKSIDLVYPELILEGLRLSFLNHKEKGAGK
ncbi:pantothenate kinase [Desulfonauticus submarinus]|uniref:Type III pantothenate kinase n=1 Tax=Desulfonauticus submarinus TaxID=206665 RepID=A0A1H0ER27_9BACT|nr:type III pantothenate kinase [Desulfonauticus submarinus]SDN84801.1 pantothenate kinase [Desulfonauticus submarinus]